MAFARTFLAVVLAIVFVFTVPIVLALFVALLGSTGPPSGSWLTIRLEGSLLEHYGPPTLGDILDDPPPCLMEVTENLEKAAVDGRIAGVLFLLEGFSASQGKLDEIRDGIRGVREAGKPVHAYAFSLTDSGIYLGSECESLSLSPKGRAYFLGRSAVLEHVRGTLQKLDVREQFHAAGDYKSAVEYWTKETASRETLENLQWILEDLDAGFDETLAANRGLDPAALAGFRERAVLAAPEAVEAGLVDEAVWLDELEERLAGASRKWKSVSSADYAEVDRADVRLAGRTRVAVIHAQGFIASGGSDRWDAMLGLVMGPDRVIEDLDRAREDEDIRAILLRCDTGGGSTTGSQRIMRAVARARDEKPVVVSIADHAASGGYMMSYPANRIVCAPAGITGSIGSIIGKLNTRGLLEKLGVTFDDFTLSPNAFLFSGLHDWTEEQWRIVGEDNWRTYTEWVEDVARERGISFDEADAVAGGRVWTGRQAAEKGLVDVLGGFSRAVAEIRHLADLEEDEKVSLVHYPKQRSLLELILSGDLRPALASEIAREVQHAQTLRSRLPESFAYEPFRTR